MNGENHFSMRDVIKTGWHNVKGTKWAIWAPLIVAFLIYIGVGLIFGLLAGLTGIFPNFMTPQLTVPSGFIAGVLVFEIIVIFLTAPLLVGAQMAALKKLRGEEVGGRTGFRYWHKWLPVGFTMLLFAIGSFIINQIFGRLMFATMAANLTGLNVLFVILFIIALLCYVSFFMFNMLFVADKDKGPWGALGHSAKMVSKHWLRVIGLIIFSIIVLTITALPAVLGAICPVDWVKVLGILVSIGLLIWSYPWYHLIVSGIFNKLAD